MTPMTIAPPLREVAELKVNQFDQLKQDFRTRYGISAPRPTNVTIRQRIAALVKDVQRFDPYLEDDGDLTIIARYVEQTADDSYMSNDKLLKFEEQILEKLYKRMHRYDATSLHLHMMMEAMGAKRAPAPESDAASLDYGFEFIENGLESLWEKFEAEAFSTKDIDAEALETYLICLMEGNGAFASLDQLRNGMCRYGEELLNGDADIEEDELEWCIMDLLKSDLIQDEKRKTLEGYIQNRVAIKELLGVLNMRSIRDWDWKYSDKGLPVTARQDVEGQYHMIVEEDLIDMLLLHCTAIGWAQKLKECLSDFVRYLDVGDKRCLSSENHREREFFLSTVPYEPPQEQFSTSSDYCTPPPPPPPMPANWGVSQGVYIFPGPSKKKHKKRIPRVLHDPMLLVPPPPPPPGFTMIAPPPPPPPPPAFVQPSSPIQLDTLDYERHRVYKRDFFMSRLPAQDGCRPKVTPIEEAQANLVKTLAAEIKLRKALDGQPGCSVVEFHSLATALPHKVVLVILKFLGVPEVIVDFFTRFLSANLNIGPSVHGTRDRILTRTCGVPENHGLQLFFTEAVMFFAELAVCKRTGLQLYRLGSRCYFVGTEEQNDQAMQELIKFSVYTKLDFDDVLTQPDRIDIGFLELAGDATTIKNSLVDAYAFHVKKRLLAQSTMYEWIRIWNITAGTYAAHLFGPLVDLFGKRHLEAVRAAYKRIFDIVFEGSNLTEHVKEMLRARSDFARTSSPLALEAIIYLPQAFGGLGVKNPLSALNIARNIVSDPEAIVQEYLDVEAKYYETALNNWSILKPEHIAKKVTHIFHDNYGAVTASIGANGTDGSFMTKTSLTKHREYSFFPHLPPTLLQDNPLPLLKETRIPYLVGLYRALLNEPIDNIIASKRVRDEVRECGPMKRWEQLDPQDKWVLQLYGDECFKRYGTLDIWCEMFVPGICMLLVRGADPYSLDDDGTSTMTSDV